MNDWTRRDIFECAWKHFDVIADQRLRTFNYYVILLAATVGASLSAIQNHPEPFIYIVIGIFCILIAIIFLIIEIRSRRLLQVPKDVLSKLEDGDHWPQDLRLFSSDTLRQSPFKNQIISYSFAFRATFALHIFYGLIFILIAACPHFSPSPSAGQSTKKTPTMQPSQTRTQSSTK